MFSNCSTLCQSRLYSSQETGTYYLRARYYDPKRGRFTQEDTLALNVFTCSPQILLIAQVGNKYVYCANNPVMYSDPSGNKVDLSPDPRQVAIDEGSGGTPPADEPGTGGGSPDDPGSTGGQKPNLPPLPDEGGSGQADTGSGGDAPTPTAVDFDEGTAEESAVSLWDAAGDFLESLVDFEVTSTYEESTDLFFLGVSQTYGMRNVYTGDPSRGALTLGVNKRLDEVWFSSIYARLDFIWFNLELNVGLDSIGFNFVFDIGDDSGAAGYYVDLSKLSLCAETCYTDVVDENNFVDYFNSTSISFLDLALLFWSGTLPQFSVPSNPSFNPSPI